MADPNQPSPRLDVSGAGGGVGVTTLAAALGALLAVSGRGPVVACDATADQCLRLIRRVHGHQVVPLMRPHSGDSDDPEERVGRRGQSRSEPGLRIVQPSEIAALLSHRDVAVVVDRGVLMAGAWPDEHRPVRLLVARADPAGVDAAVIHAARSAHPPDLIAVVDTGRFAGPVRRSGARLAASVAPTVLVPHSPALQCSPIRIDRLERTTAAAICDLLAQCVQLNQPVPGGQL